MRNRRTAFKLIYFLAKIVGFSAKSMRDSNESFDSKLLRRSRAVARALIGGGGGGVYSYIRVMPD